MAECLRSVALVLHKIPVVVKFFEVARNIPEEHVIVVEQRQRKVLKVLLINSDDNTPVEAELRRGRDNFGYVVLGRMYGGLRTACQGA